jgi:hypothetical protein
VRSAPGAVTITRGPSGVPPDVARQYEQVVRDVLAGEGAQLAVEFGTWVEDDGRIQAVCRVEAPPADPFGLEVQWRWWSPLLDGPDALREELGAAVARRRRQRAGRDVVAPSPSEVRGGSL